VFINLLVYETAALLKPTARAGDVGSIQDDNLQTFEPIKSHPFILLDDKPVFLSFVVRPRSRLEFIISHVRALWHIWVLPHNIYEGCLVLMHTALCDTMWPICVSYLKQPQHRTLKCPFILTVTESIRLATRTGNFRRAAFTSLKHLEYLKHDGEPIHKPQTGYPLVPRHPILKPFPYMVITCTLNQIREGVCRAQIMKLLMMQSSPVSCYFLC
jgi:hypothetical protein